MFKKIIQFVAYTSMSVFSINCLASAPKELILALGGERVEGYDPIKGWGRYGSLLFQSTLLKRDDKLNIIYDLATKYSLSKDKKLWYIELRKDAKFSDGTELTAKDVVFTFNRARDEAGKTDATNIEKVLQKSKYSLEIYLKNPQITSIELLLTLGIVPAHLYSDNYNKKPIGSGPFVLMNWDEGQQMIVEPNPFYYGKKPNFERIIFMFTPEDSSFAAAKANKVHLVTVPQAFAVEKLPNMKLVVVNSVDNRGIMFPMQKSNGAKTSEGYPIGNNVTSDIGIRKAINYAIDRKALVDGVLEGFGSPAFGPADDLPWDNKDARFKDADIVSAKKILAENGWESKNGEAFVAKKGVKAEFDLLYPSSDSTRQNLALAVKDMLAKIGIKVNIVGKSWDEMMKLSHSNAVMYGWGSHNPQEIHDVHHSKMAGIEHYNAGYYSNKKVDEYFFLAQTSPTFEASLVEWRKAFWDGKTGFSVKGDAAWAWLVNLKHTYFVNKCLDIGSSRIEPHGHGWPITANIESWKWSCGL